MGTTTRPQKSARVASLLLLVVFVAIYSSCAESTSLRCSRSDGSCLLTRETLFRTRRHAFKVQDLLGAHSEFASAGRRGQRGQLTILETRQGPIPFQRWNSTMTTGVSGPVMEFVKDRSREELLVTDDTRWKVFGAASFLLAGSALLFGLSFARSLTDGSRR
jgi:hypothetical protein